MVVAATAAASGSEGAGGRRLAREALPVGPPGFQALSALLAPLFRRASRVEEKEAGLAAGMGVGAWWCTWGLVGGGA